MAQHKVCYFLGANSPNGFYSLYDQLIDPGLAEDIFILKGGPGCGKSSLMRTVGKAMEDKGLYVEYIQCSGDPDSLDGIVIPALKTAIVDGTAPHVVVQKSTPVQQEWTRWYFQAHCPARRPVLLFSKGLLSKP